MVLFIISFLAGVLTVLSPCVLPLLPVSVGSSLAGGVSYRRAFTVTISLGVSVFLFTFLLKVSTAFIMVPPFVWNWISGGILFIVGIFFIFPDLWDIIPGTARANRDSNQLMSKGFMQQDFWGDVLVGAALGPVFSTCSPTYFIVLATVLPINLALGAIDILAYVLGLCIFLLFISLVGQRVIGRLSLAADGRGWFKRLIGGLFVIISVLVVTNSLAAVEAPLYNFFDETRIERYFLQHRGAADSSGGQVATTTGAISTSTSTNAASVPKTAITYLTPVQKALRYHQAPELVLPDAYLNTDGKPISLAQYRGKNVVLLDFWTYSCINCQRTLPYLTTWYEKYKNQGLVIIGVHTPEFAFEHLESNVTAALKQFGITYPVVLDNEYRTWNAYGNEYWPHEYIIDIDGFITHDHSGEGEYDITEKAIQDALGERAARLKVPAMAATSTVGIAPHDLSGIQSPETYFGSNRNQYLGNGTPGTAGVQMFTLPETASVNTLYLGGSWNLEAEYATNTSPDAVIEYTYKAADLYFVASGPEAGVQIQVIQDGLPLTGKSAGEDVVNGMLTVTGSRLYQVVKNPTAGVHTLKLIVKKPGLQAYTLTFG